MQTIKTIFSAWRSSRQRSHPQTKANGRTRTRSGPLEAGLEKEATGSGDSMAVEPQEWLQEAYKAMGWRLLGVGLVAVGCTLLYEAGQWAWAQGGRGGLLIGAVLLALGVWPFVLCVLEPNPEAIKRPFRWQERRVVWAAAALMSLVLVVIAYALGNTVLSLLRAF